MCFKWHSRFEAEKARQFHQGLKPSIRHVLGAFSVVDFRTMVEQALGVEMQQTYTIDMQKSSGGEKPCNHGDKKGHSGGPAQKKGRFQRHQPYHNKSSSDSSGSTLQYRAIPKPGMGLVCFRCGDAHRRVECKWNGRCEICGLDHKEVVCRKNPNGKVRWEPVSSSAANSGIIHMMATSPFVQQQLPALPTQ